MISTRAWKDSALAISTSCWSAMDRPRAGLLGVEVDAEPLEEGGCRRRDRPVVDPAQGAARLAADEDVLGDREVGEERRLLVDDGDSGVPRVRGSVHDHGYAVQQHGPGVRPVDPGERLDQGRLAGAVLTREGVRLARVQREGDVAQRPYGSEGLAHPLQRENRRPFRYGVGHGRLLSLPARSNGG